MRPFAYTLILLTTLLLTSCNSVRVVSDHDKEVDFTQYTTYAFYKPVIDQAKISDLDKRRILRAIDNELTQKGMSKSDTPEMIISIYTKEQERVDIYQDYYSYGWGPYYGPYGPYRNAHVSQRTEGTLFIDLIDAESKTLIWQGIGYSDLITKDSESKEKRINEIVSKILEAYPPQQ